MGCGFGKSKPVTSSSSDSQLPLLTVVKKYLLFYTDFPEEVGLLSLEFLTPDDLYLPELSTLFSLIETRPTKVYDSSLKKYLNYRFRFQITTPSLKQSRFHSHVDCHRRQLTVENLTQIWDQLINNFNHYQGCLTGTARSKEISLNNLTIQSSRKVLFEYIQQLELNDCKPIIEFHSYYSNSLFSNSEHYYFVIGRLDFKVKVFLSRF